MRKPLILLFVIAVAPSLFAQSLTEKIDVNLVNVDVTVTSHGAPARGLNRDDFEVLEDGVPQTITNFYAIEGSRANPASSAKATPVAVAEAPTAAGPTEERSRRKVLVI